MSIQRQDQGSIESCVPPSHGWSDSTKQLILTAGVVLTALMLYRFRQLLPPLVIALILAYILNPAVGLIPLHVAFAHENLFCPFH